MSFEAGKASFKLGDYATAAEQFYSVVTKDDNDHKSWNALGICLSKLGKYDDANICFLNALDICPNNETYKRNQLVNSKEITPNFNQNQSANNHSPNQFKHGDNFAILSIAKGVVGIVVLIVLVSLIFSIIGSVSPPTSSGTEIREDTSNDITYYGNDQSNNKIKTCERIVQQYSDSHDYQSDTYDCDDMAMDVWNMLQKENINSQLVIGDVKNDIQYPWEANHAWVLAEIDTDEWLALEATGGFVERDNPLYYQGWFFNSPLELKEYRELMNVYDNQIDKLNRAIDEYNIGVDQFNKIQSYDSSQYLQVGMDLSSASSVLQERYNDIADTQNRMMELLQGHSINDNDLDSNPPLVIEYQEIPTVIPTTPLETHSGDIILTTTLLEAGKSLESSRVDILNKLNNNDYYGARNAINQLESKVENYSNQINKLDISPRLWVFRDYLVKGFEHYGKACRKIISVMDCYEDVDCTQKTLNERTNHAKGEFNTGNMLFLKADTELARVS